MESSGSRLPASSRLLRVESSHVAPRGHHNHVSYFRAGPRASDGLYNTEVQRLRFLRYDATDAYRHGTEEQVGQRQDTAEQCTVLVQHDLGPEYGK
jgi:hypothetical protein